MAGLTNITPKPVTRQAYQLSTPEDMLAALKYLRARGYTGTIQGTETVDGVPSWRLWLNHPLSNSGQSGTINDIIVIENDSVAKIITPAQFGALYTTTT